jgi:hypothetical protein
VYRGGVPYQTSSQASCLLFYSLDYLARSGSIGLIIRAHHSVLAPNPGQIGLQAFLVHLVCFYPEAHRGNHQ